MVYIAFYSKCEVNLFSLSLVSASVFMRRKLYWQAFYRTAILKFLGKQSTIKAVVGRCSVKSVFLEILQNWKENTCARVSFLIKLQGEFCENFKNTFFHRTPMVAASVQCIRLLLKLAASLENEFIRSVIFWAKSNI